MKKMDKYTKAIVVITFGVVVIMVLYAIWLVSGVGGESSKSTIPIAALIPSFLAIFISIITAARRKNEEEMKHHQIEEQKI